MSAQHPVRPSSVRRTHHRRSSSCCVPLGLIGTRDSKQRLTSNAAVPLEVRLAAPKGSPMETSLAGRKVLIVEDEPLIALDIVTAFKHAGAVPVAARTLAEARNFVEQDGLSAAVLDFGLGDGDADQLCHRLTEREVPFVLHSGYGHADGACSKGISVPKPATPEALIRAVVKLLHIERR